jgi:hypothetical protein
MKMTTIGWTRSALVWASVFCCCIFSLSQACHFSQACDEPTYEIQRAGGGGEVPTPFHEPHGGSTIESTHVQLVNWTGRVWILRSSTDGELHPYFQPVLARSRRLRNQMIRLLDSPLTDWTRLDQARVRLQGQLCTQFMTKAATAETAAHTQYRVTLQARSVDVLTSLVESIEAFYHFWE